jgi:RNA polymerase sigma-70 factor (ECF subfamily)
MSLRDPRTDAELLLATRDPEAFAIFYRRHVRQVMAFCARQVAADEVGDLVSEVFATALVYRRRFDPGRGMAAAWLVGIASHKVADARRRGAVEARTYQRIGGRRLRLDVAELESDLGSDELLQDLPSDQRRAVFARVVGDQSYEQIAREQDVSPEVARKRVSRALRTLRSRLSEGRQ